MKIGKSFNPGDFFNKASDTSDDITEGATKLFYLNADKTKVGYLPTGENCYLEIEKLATEPVTGTEGEVYYNTTDSKFYLYKVDAWVESLFSMEEITP